MIWGMRRDRVQQQELGIDFFHFQTHGHHSTTMYRRLQIELIDNRDDKINSVGEPTELEVWARARFLICLYL